MNYTDILHPQNSLSQRYLDTALMISASWLLALSAQFAFQLPFSPIPVTGQTLVVLLCGWMLGKKRATAAVGLYLLQGAVGLPFFAGGTSGWAVLIGPTGGYLAGFLAAAFLVGMLSELHFQRSLAQAVITLLLGNITIYVFGLAWLVRFVSESQVLKLGFYPYLIGDGLKLIIAVSLACTGSWIIDHYQTRKDPH